MANDLIVNLNHLIFIGKIVVKQAGMKKIKLTEEQLNKLILKERVSQTIYHYCPIQTAYRILETNKLWCMSSLDKQAENVAGNSFNNPYYLSCTRSKTTHSGYAYQSANHGACARVELDGDLINSNFKGNAVDYWVDSKNNFQKMNRPDGDKAYTKHPDVEIEDRIFTKAPYIDVASRFIKSIDIYLEPTMFEAYFKYLYPIYKASKSISPRVNVRVYFERSDFDAQNDNFAPWDYILQHSETNQSLPTNDKNDTYALIKYLTAVLRITLCPVYDKQHIFHTIREYGLEALLKNKNMIDKIDDISRYGYQYFVSDISRMEVFRDAQHGNDTKDENTMKVGKILTDWAKKHKLTSWRDINNYIKEFTNRTEDGIPNILEKPLAEITLYAAKKNYDDEWYVIGDPNVAKYRTAFWRDDLDDALYDLQRGINIDDDAISSKSYEAFVKYLKRVSKMNPSVQYVADMYNNLLKRGNNELDLTYKPEIKEMTVTASDLSSLIMFGRVYGNNTLYCNTKSEEVKQYLINLLWQSQRKK